MQSSRVAVRPREPSVNDGIWKGQGLVLFDFTAGAGEGAQSARAAKPTRSPAEETGRPEWGASDHKAASFP